MRPIASVFWICLVFSTFVGIACARHQKPLESITGESNGSTTITCSGCEAHSVARMVDEDTFELSDGTRIRFYGMDLPEQDQPCFSEATDRLRQLVGSAVRLEDGPRLMDTDGRRLAYAYTSEGFSINVLLIREGLATAWERAGQHAFTLMDIERSTSYNRVGCLWG